MVGQAFNLEIQLTQPLIYTVRNFVVRIPTDRWERDQFSQVFMSLHDLNIMLGQEVRKLKGLDICSSSAHG